MGHSCLAWAKPGSGVYICKSESKGKQYTLRAVSEKWGKSEGNRVQVQFSAGDKLLGVICKSPGINLKT
jgi:hypothetical protein